MNSFFVSLCLASNVVAFFIGLPTLNFFFLLIIIFCFCLRFSFFSFLPTYQYGVDNVNNLISLLCFGLFFSIFSFTKLLRFHFLNQDKGFYHFIGDLFECVINARQGVYAYINAGFFYGGSCQFYLSTWTVLFQIFAVFTLLVYLFSFFPLSSFDGYHRIEFFFLLGFSFLGILCLLFVADFCLLFLSLELTTYCLFMLCASGTHENIFGIEAALKYFILSTVSSAFFLFGLSFIYLTTGCLSFFDLRLFLLFLELDTVGLTNIVSLNFSFFLVLSALLLKVGAAPFHVWAPDVYSGAPFLVTAYFATVAKVGFLGVLARLCWELVNFSFVFSDYRLLLFVSGVASVVVGVFGAFFQARLKRWIAYSGIVHIGFLVVALPLAQELSSLAFFFYLFSYLLLVFSFLILMNSRSLVKSGSKIQTVYDLKYLFFSKSEFSVLIIFTLFSFAGVPPFIGFYAKFLVLYALVQEFHYFLAILLLVLSVLSAYYYLRLISFIFFDSVKRIYEGLCPAPIRVVYIFMFLSIINILGYYVFFEFWYYFSRISGVLGANGLKVVL